MKKPDQADPEKPKQDLTDACSCTTCDSMGCFVYRQNKCCSCGQCKDYKTNIDNESKKIDTKETHSHSSDCIARIQKPASIDCCARNNAAETNVDTSKYADLENRLKEKFEKLYKYDNEICRLTNPVTAEQVAPVKNSDKELDCVGTKLSAQIMNLSYRDFKQTLSYNRSDTASYKISKLSKYDIFQKIKEVYQACSCKVCECLVGKSRNDACKCKPCECSDCVSCMDKIKQTESSKTVKERCGCKQYEKTFADIAKKLNDNNRICSCKPCDCIECTADYFVKPCDCAPCQCVECKSMYVHKQAPVTVAPVLDVQRNSCQCSPCECIECGLRYGLSTNLMHEMATGTIRQKHAECRCELCQNDACEPDGVGSCKCDRRNRVMSKPVEKDAHVYDIRTALVNNSILPAYNETIAMFADLSNNYPKFIKDNTKQCTCDECECVVCSYKEDAINAIKSSQLFTPAKLQLDKSRLNTDACKCQQCECELYYKYKRSQPDRQKQCLWDICDCLICRRRKAVPTTEHMGKSGRECRLCEKNCNKLNATRERQHPCVKCMICKRCIQDDTLSSELGDTTKSVSTSQYTSFSLRDSQSKIKSQQESLSIYEAFPTLDVLQQSHVSNTKTVSYGTIRQASMSGIKRKGRKYPKTCNILKCDAYTQYKKRNRGLYKSNSLGYKASGSYSESSSKTNSKSSSYYKENGCVTPISGHKDKSSESSCNSSGYDYPDYLVQFPKSTVETCLKDVMKLNLDKNIKLDKLKIAPNSPTRKRCVNNTLCTNTISGKERLSQGYEFGYEANRMYKKHKSIDETRSSHRRLKRETYKNEETYTPLQRNYSNRLAAYKEKAHRGTLNMTMDKSNINKNNFTQTVGLGEHESQTSTRIDRYESESDSRGNLQTAKNLKDFQISRNVYDYSVLNQGVPNIIQNDHFQRKFSHISPFKYYSNSTDFFKIDEDYKRIQNTLREAKVFSADLMKILEKYEKDNREFVSIAEKLKHKSTFNNNTIKSKEICDVKNPTGDSQYKNQYSTEHELRQIHLENSSMEEKISLQVFPKTMVYDRSQEKNTIMQQTLDIPNFKRVNTNDRLIMVIVPQENSNFKVKSTNAKEVITKENELPNQGIKEAPTDLNIHKHHGVKTYKREHRNYNKLMKRAVLLSKKISIGNGPKPPVNSATIGTCNTSSSNTVIIDNKVKSESISTEAVDQSIKKNERADIKKSEMRDMRKFDTLLGSTETSACTSIDNIDRTRQNIDDLEGSATMQTQHIEGKNPWPILKKNFSFVPKASNKSKGVYIYPTLEHDVKEEVQVISLQIKDKTESRTPIGLQSHHADSDLALEMTQQEPAKDESDVHKDTPNFLRKGENIERQIKDLLDLKLLQPIMKKLLNTDNLLSVFDADNDLPRIGSSKSSCEALKASFLGLRRVSDHTVLVKWNLPREVTDVQGYELLVDGRAVQKIFSPSKCMAVITCLPHTDKILLTIRTITAMVALTGHYPAASIVYHPRIK